MELAMKNHISVLQFIVMARFIRQKILDFIIYFNATNFLIFRTDPLLLNARRYSL